MYFKGFEHTTEYRLFLEPALAKKGGEIYLSVFELPNFSTKLQEPIARSIQLPY